MAAQRMLAEVACRFDVVVLLAGETHRVSCPNSPGAGGRHGVRGVNAADVTPYGHTGLLLKPRQRRKSVHVLEVAIISAQDRKRAMAAKGIRCTKPMIGQTGH